MYRPWGSHSHLLPMVSSSYCLYVCSVIVSFICVKKFSLKFSVKILIKFSSINLINKFNKFNE